MRKHIAYVNKVTIQNGQSKRQAFMFSKGLKLNGLALLSPEHRGSKEPIRFKSNSSIEVENSPGQASPYLKEHTLGTRSPVPKKAMFSLKQSKVLKSP